MFSREPWARARVTAYLIQKFHRRSVHQNSPL